MGVDFYRMRQLMRQLQADERNVAAAFTRATRITQSFSDDPHAPGITDRVGSGAVELEEARRVRDETAAELTALREQLRSRLDSLPENIRNVMQLRYIVGASWQMVAIQCHYSQQHTFRLLNQGEAMINSDETNKHVIDESKRS